MPKSPPICHPSITQNQTNYYRNWFKHPNLPSAMRNRSRRNKYKYILYINWAIWSEKGAIIIIFHLFRFGLLYSTWVCTLHITCTNISKLMMGTRYTQTLYTSHIYINCIIHTAPIVEPWDLAHLLWANITDLITPT